jgi:transcriptional regulator with XRE-family HTH domain
MGDNMPTLDEERLVRARQFDWIIGTNVRILRIQREIAQQDLAELADMDPTQLNRVEAGARSLKFRESIAICQALNVNPERLTRPLH